MDDAFVTLTTQMLADFTDPLSKKYISSWTPPTSSDIIDFLNDPSKSSEASLFTIAALKALLEVIQKRESE